MALSWRAGALALLAAVVLGVLPSWGTLLVVNALLGLALGLDVVRAGSPRAVTLTRAGPSSTRLLEPVTVHLLLENTGSRRVVGTVRDAWVPSAGALTERHSVDLEPGARAQVDTVLSPRRRGRRAADRVTVRAWGPLRLAARQRSFELAGWVDVLPPFRSRRHLPSRLARLRELDGRVSLLQRGQGGEFDSLREYVPGDDVRAIDWRASARAADIMVQTFRPERDRRVLLVLDTGRTSAARIGIGDPADPLLSPRLDAAMDAALLLAVLAEHAGDRVELLAFDRTVRARVAGQGRGSTISRMLPALTSLEPALLETDLEALVATVLGYRRHPSLVVLFSSLDPSALRPGRGRTALGVLAARQPVLLASVADPRVAELAALRGDAPRVYAAAAATAALTERDRLRAELNRAGVQVLDASPEELPPALADAYLALKRAGRL